MRDTATRSRTRKAAQRPRDLFLAGAEDALLSSHATWPRVTTSTDSTPLVSPTTPTPSYASDLKLAAVCRPAKAQHSASPEELQDMVDDLQKEHACAVAWYFPYAYRKLRNEAGNYHPGIAVLFKEARG